MILRHALCTLLFAGAVPVAQAGDRVDGIPPVSVREPGAVLLEAIPWTKAEKALTPEAIVVIPLGAAAKEHGPHLPLNTDFIQAEYVKKAIAETSDVVIAPTINYSYYPVFLEFPGSTTLRLSTARDSIIDVVHSLAYHGPRRFYVINIGLTTISALQEAAKQLASEGILLRYTDLDAALGDWTKSSAQQKEGSHADEVETSLMLYMSPSSVHMPLAVKDGHVYGFSPISRDATKTSGVVSPSGIYGDATLATRKKGEELTALVVKSVKNDIDALRKQPLPVPSEGCVPLIKDLVSDLDGYTPEPCK